MIELRKDRFSAALFLANAGMGRKISLKPNCAFFSQGDPADSVFYLREGGARISALSATGREATIALLYEGSFIGEEALSAATGLRLSSATATTVCVALKMGREEMLRLMHLEQRFSDVVLKFLLERSMRVRKPISSISSSILAKSAWRGFASHGRIWQARRTQRTPSKKFR